LKQHLIESLLNTADKVIKSFGVSSAILNIKCALSNWTWWLSCKEELWKLR